MPEFTLRSISVAAPRAPFSKLGTTIASSSLGLCTLSLARSRCVSLFAPSTFAVARAFVAPVPFNAAPASAVRVLLPGLAVLQFGIRLLRFGSGDVATAVHIPQGAFQVVDLVHEGLAVAYVASAVNEVALSLARDIQRPHV